MWYSIRYMKNSRKGFVVPLLIIIAVLVIGGGVYYYSKNKGSFNIPAQYQSTNNTPSDSGLSITDPKDVKDFDTCMSYAKNIPTNFDIVFAHGSDIQNVTNVEADFQKAYPQAKLKVSTEQDAMDEAVAYNGGSIKTASGLADYKKQITPQLTSKISVSIPLQYLGTKKNFDDFMSMTLSKYPQAKFQQYAGSSPETFLSDSTVSVGEAQYVYQQQCTYKYKTLNASGRASLDLKTADQSIQLGVQVTMLNASRYYEDHASYGSGALSLNNGVCSDTGVYGLSKSLDSLTKNAGVSYCYASATAFAVSAPLKSDPTTGYCTDSTGFFGEASPTAASKGYCVAPKKVSQDISACKNSGATARERWICVGNIVDPTPPFHIQNIVMPFATPVSQKVDFCKTFSGIEADYCFASIMQSQGTAIQEAKSVCSMVSDKNPWFKADCLQGN
jgi:hypothetical protein